jgi:hypothetical protein
MANIIVHGVYEKSGWGVFGYPTQQIFFSFLLIRYWAVVKAFLKPLLVDWIGKPKISGPLRSRQVVRKIELKLSQ